MSFMSSYCNLNKYIVIRNSFYELTKCVSKMLGKKLRERYSDCAQEFRLIYLLTFFCKSQLSYYSKNTQKLYQVKPGDP